MVRGVRLPLKPFANKANRLHIDINTLTGLK
jgi:hypothetical protein